MRKVENKYEIKKTERKEKINKVYNKEGRKKKGVKDY
jgi:hypothetical protein